MGKDNYTEWDNATAISASVIPFSNREVKSSAFTQLFREPENAAQLYTALEGKEACCIISRKSAFAFSVP